MVPAGPEFRQRLSAAFNSAFAGAVAGDGGELAIFGFEEVPSTMDVAAQLAEPADYGGAERALICGPLTGPPLAVLARRQTRGRGRLDRTWLSDLDRGVYLTLLVDLERPVAKLSGLPLVAGCAVAECALRLGANVKLKWPNDVWAIDERGGTVGKLAGVLLESSQIEGGARVAIGVGMNLESQEVAEAVGLRELSASADYAHVAAFLVSEIYTAIQRFGREGFEPYRARCNELSLLRDRMLSVGDEYVATGGEIQADGALVVYRDGERRLVYSGDVRLRPIGPER